jgi:uncharacterized protein YdgA (DUF945 family)
VLLMKKIILVVLLIGIVSLGAVSLWGSMRAKQVYRTLILEIAEYPDAQILETSYERGWLQSRAATSFEVRGPLGESFQRWLAGRGRDEVRGRVGIRIRQTIEHGYTPLLEWLTGGLEGTPVLGRVETQLELDEETQSELAAVIGRLPAVRISTVIRAPGVGESSVTVPARLLEGRLAADEGGGWAARWSGLRGNVIHTAELDRFAASFQSPGIEGRNADLVFAVRDLQWTADMERDESGLPVGDVSLRIGTLRLSSQKEGAPEFGLDRWTMTQSSAVEEGSFNSSLESRLHEIRLGEYVYGPGNAELQLRNLDALSLVRLQSRGAPGLSSPNSSDVARTAVEGGAIGLLPDLVSRSPQLEIRSLRLSTPAGDLEATLRVHLDGSRPEFVRDPVTLPLALQVQVEFQCPAEMLDALTQGMEEELLALRREGWILLDGDRYRSRLAFERGKLIVNGIPKALGQPPEQPEAPDALPQISAVDPSRPEGVAPGPELLP